MRWFLATRQVVETRDLRTLSIADLDRLRETRRRFANARMEALYGAWLPDGERALDRGTGASPTVTAPVGQLLTRELPSTYSQFGSWPGVC